MKILANPEIKLVQQTISYRLPHLAIELQAKNQEVLEDGILVNFSNFKFNFTARVFKPGDGSRLIFKDFLVEYTTLITISWIQKILSLCLVKNNVYQTKSHKEIVTDLTNFFETAGSNIIFLGKTQNILSTP